MKTLLPQLLKSKLAQAGGLLAVVAAFAASMAWSRPPEMLPVKLEGAWVAQLDNGIRVLWTYAPSDPTGRSVTFRAQMVWPPEALASLGLDAVTDEVAEVHVTGINTAAWTGVWYGLAGGRIVMIFIDHSTLTLESSIRGVAEHTVAAYLATADADNDGYPDPGTTPVATFTSKSIGKRVTR